MRRSWVLSNPVTFDIKQCCIGRSKRARQKEKVAKKGKPATTTRHCSHIWVVQTLSNDDDFKVGKKKKDTSPNNKHKIGGKVVTEYDQQWFIGEMIAYNKAIDQQTIYF